MRARPVTRMKARTILPETPASPIYDADCRRCARLAAFLDVVRAENPGYFCRPVPPFGVRDASLVIVGLAPGMHGANASGRPFTGDHAGIILYQTLHAYGFGSRPVATSRDDGLEPSALPFAHGSRHALERGIALFDSYHCSRYNTNTGRLTATMFSAVFDSIAAHLGRGVATRAA
jgi:uracil-DNA glycosylase